MLPALHTELGDAGTAPGASRLCSLGCKHPLCAASLPFPVRMEISSCLFAFPAVLNHPGSLQVLSRAELILEDPAGESA